MCIRDRAIPSHTPMDGTRIGVPPVSYTHLLICGSTLLELAVHMVHESGNRQAVAVHLVDREQDLLDHLDGEMCIRDSISAKPITPRPILRVARVTAPICSSG